MSRPAFPLLRQILQDYRAREMSRREFLTHATALGLSSSMFGTRAGATTPVNRRFGGTLRIQQSVRPLSDPRSYDWSELGNQTRGFLEYLVEYQQDGSFAGMLAERWDVNADASRYTLHLRLNVRWNNGDPFTAQDVAHNFARWCDTTFPGNSMAGRLTGLIDPATGQLRPDAVQIEDSHTITLHLAAPDMTLIANLADYPAAIVHPGFAGDDPFAHGIGTGPFRPVEMTVGSHCVLERNPDHLWWGTEVFGGPYLDRVEFIDYGTDPLAWERAAEAGEVDLLYETVGDFVASMDALGWIRSSVTSAATCVIRTNQRAEIDGLRPYADLALRRALALAVQNEICLELGYGGHGTVAANDHVSPIHPAFADLGPSEYDPAAAHALRDSTGRPGFEHELITLDDEWQRNTGDAVAAQLRDAGFAVRRVNHPGSRFWQSWRDYPFSLTQWNHRPLAVQIMQLAYRSDAVWNETGFANAEFDSLLDLAMTQADAAARRGTMARLQTILRQEGVIIQPYWRTLYNHQSGLLVGAEKHPAHEIHLHRIGFAA